MSNTKAFTKVKISPLGGNNGQYNINFILFVFIRFYLDMKTKKTTDFIILYLIFLSA